MGMGGQERGGQKKGGDEGRRRHLPGRLISKSKILGRDWLPILSRSLKPRVTTSALLSPSRSRRALVATVVPIRMKRIRDVSRGLSRGCGSPAAPLGR